MDKRASGSGNTRREGDSPETPMHVADKTMTLNVTGGFLSLPFCWRPSNR
jgi:hypothetical protein